MHKYNKIIHCKLVAPIRPLKDEVNRVRVTLGECMLEHETHKSIVPATLTAVNTYLNSVISTPEAFYVTM